MKIGNNDISKVYIGSDEIKKVYLGSIQVHGNSQPTPSWDGLTFTAQEANSTIKYKPSTVSTASYSTDGTNWNSFDNVTVTLANVGDKIYVKGVISGNHTTSNYANFSMTGKIAASGSIMSMYNNNPDDTVIAYTGAFRSMFTSCSLLTQAPELPATQLAISCYANLFYGCSSLTTAPELPATQLATTCYNSMFQGCTSLTTAPELPATTLSSSCYKNMFYGCTSLTVAPELLATTLANGCYGYMFSGCSSLTSVTHHITNWNTSYAGSWLNNVAASGTVICPSNSTIPADNTSGIPIGWTRINI